MTTHRDFFVIDHGHQRHYTKARGDACILLRHHEAAMQARRQNLTPKAIQPLDCLLCTSLLCPAQRTAAIKIHGLVSVLQKMYTSPIHMCTVSASGLMYCILSTVAHSHSTQGRKHTIFGERFIGFFHSCNATSTLREPVPTRFKHTTYVEPDTLGSRPIRLECKATDSRVQVNPVYSGIRTIGYATSCTSGLDTEERDAEQDNTAIAAVRATACCMVFCDRM